MHRFDNDIKCGTNARALSIVLSSGITSCFASCVLHHRHLFVSTLAATLGDEGVGRLLVAGGETSGAVATALGCDGAD